MAQDTEFFEFKNNLPEINKGIKELSASLNKLNSSLGTSSRANDKYTQSNNRLENSIGDTDDKVEKLNKSNEKQSGIVSNLTSKLGKLGTAYKYVFSRISPINLGTIGLSTSMSGLIGTAFGEIRALSQLGDSLTYLSSETGSVSGAMNMLHTAAGQSTLSIGTMQGVFKSLSDQGVDTKKDFMDLSKLAGDMASATGVTASSYSNFTGELSYKYGVPISGLKSITSSLIATGLTGNALEKVIGSVNKVLSNTAFIAGKTTPKAFENTTKAINSSIYAFKELKISAEMATGFIEGITDPDKFEENAYMFGKMGISVSDYSDMLMDADNGQKRLINTVMTKLPELSKQIKSIQNPFVMRDFAKSLNIPLEMMQKMANSSEEDMERLLKTYQQQAEEDKALKKKQEEQKAEAAKFDDALAALKRKALQPLMNFVSNNLGNITSLFSKVSDVFAVVLKAMVPVLQVFSNKIISFSNYAMNFIKKLEPEIKQLSKMITAFSDGLFNFVDSFSPEIEEFSKNVISFTKSVVEFAKDFGPSFIKGFLQGVKDVGNAIKQLYTYIEPVVSSLMSFASSFIPRAPDKETGQGTAEGTGKLAVYGAALFGGFKLLKGVAGLVSSRQKTVSNAKVGELADAIGESVAKHNNSPTQMGFFKGPIMKGLMTAAVATLAYKTVSEGIKEVGGSKRSEVMGGGAAAYYAGKSTMSGETLKAISDASNAKGFRGRIDAFKESKSLSKTLTELERVGVKNLDLSKNWKFTTKETKELFTKAYGKEAEQMFAKTTNQLKGAGLSGKVIPKAPPSGASIVKNELKDVLKSSLGIGREGRIADNVTRELKTKGLKDILKNTSYATQEASGLAKVSSNLKDTLSLSKQFSNLKEVSKNVGGFTKSFAKGGALPTLFADMAGGWLGGKAGSGLNSLLGGTEEQGKVREKAGSNLGSFGASTAAAAIYGGPVGAAINMAMIGAFRAIDMQDEVISMVETPFKRVGKNANFLDKIANTIQAGAGGALQLGIGYAVDDLIMLTTGKKTEIGNTMSAVMSSVALPVQALGVVLRTGARVYDKAVEGFKTSSKFYGMEMGLLNDKIDSAGKQLNENIRKGNYFEALSNVGTLLKLKFNEYVIDPFMNVLRSLWYGALELINKFEQYIPKDYRPINSENLLKEIKRQADLSEASGGLMNQIRKGTNVSSNIQDLKAKMDYAQQQGWNDIASQIKNFLEMQTQKQTENNKTLVNEIKNGVKEGTKEGSFAGTKAAAEGQKENESDKAPPARDQYDTIIQTLLKTGYIIPLKS